MGTQENIAKKAAMLAESIGTLKMWPNDKDDLQHIIEAAIWLGWEMNDEATRASEQ